VETRRRIKTDLVIGMTLAEMFLLILFIVWYAQGATAGPEWEKIAEAREQEIRRLEAALKVASEQIDELERIRDWWRANFAIEPPTAMSELTEGLGANGKEIVEKKTARSNLTPACSEVGLKDVLFDTVIVGRNRYTVSDRSLTLEELLSAHGSDLEAARKQSCRYFVTVTYAPDVHTKDYVHALVRLRGHFYVRLR
jgi:hypothetical protein